LKVDFGLFEDAVKRENALEAYSACARIVETADKLKKLLRMHRDAAAFEL